MSTLPLRTERLSAKLHVTLAGAAVNLLLAAGKVAAGIYGRSEALIVDGVHSFSDLATDILVFVALRVAGHGADETHPYGHGRFETAAAVLLGLVLTALAGGLFGTPLNACKQEPPCGSRVAGRLALPSLRS